jgi:integrase
VQSLARYADPGDTLVRELDTARILRLLNQDVAGRPLWLARPSVGERLRSRIEQVLDFAAAHGYREGENPAQWKPHLEHALGKSKKPVEHYAALPHREVGAFMAKLRARPEPAARALEFLILTAARSGEVRGATADEVDLQSQVWTIPAARMKGGAEHRVPLSRASLVRPAKRASHYSPI